MTDENLFLGGKERKIKNFSGSSTLVRAEYETITNRLVVLFVGGTTYQYMGVTEDIADSFFNAESPGKFLNEAIKKGKYAFKKL